MSTRRSLSTARALSAPISRSIINAQATSISEAKRMMSVEIGRHLVQNTVEFESVKHY